MKYTNNNLSEIDTITATSFIGDGAGLTNISSTYNGGTIPSATTFSSTVTFNDVRIGGYILNNTLGTAIPNTSNTTYTTIWSFNGVAGQTYKMEMIGTYQTAATTTGIKIKLGGTAVCNVAGKYYGGITNAAAATELSIPVSTMTSEIVTTGVAVINTPHFIGGDIIFKCTTSGTILVTMASEVNASSAQLNIGSTCVVERLS